MSEARDYKVADISLAEWGRKEIANVKRKLFDNTFSQVRFECSPNAHFLK